MSNAIQKVEFDQLRAIQAYFNSFYTELKISTIKILSKKVMTEENTFSFICFFPQFESNPIFFDASADFQSNFESKNVN
jgi:hypothetical protein